jgi:hypothetical protein
MADTETQTETNAVDQQPPEHPVERGPDVYESRARRMGWVSRDEFRGDGGAQWVDAETFVRRAEQSADILIERNKALDRRLEQSERSFSEYKKTSEKQLGEMTHSLKELQETLVDFRNFASTANERAYRRARSELETEMRHAVASADVERFDKAKAQVEELDAEASTFVRKETREQQQQIERQPEPAAPAQDPNVPPPPPEVLAWIGRNQWFVNPEFAYMNQYAQRVHMHLLREEPGLSLSQNLDKVTAITRGKFPEEFGINPRREAAPSTVTAATSTTRQAGKKKLGYDDLPAEAKAACDRYVKNIPGYTKDEYVKVYYSEEENA